MALNWNAQQCDPRVLGEDEWAVTETLIFASMFLGFNRITEQNAEQVATRLAAWTRAFGALVTIVDAENNLKPYPIGLADVRLRIGLATNASAMTEAAFRRNLVERLMREAAQSVARQATEATV